MSRWFKLVSAGITLVPWLLAAGAVQAESSKEYLVKSAFIYNFTKFVEWPNAGKTLNLCMKGDHNYNGALKEIEKRSNSKRRYVILEKDENTNCHLHIYDDLPQKLSNPQNVLTIGRGEAFIKKGGIISFVEKGGKIKFLINLKAAKAAGLKMNPQLLEIAHKVVR